MRVCLCVKAEAFQTKQITRFAARNFNEICYNERKFALLQVCVPSLNIASQPNFVHQNPNWTELSQVKPNRRAATWR